MLIIAPARFETALGPLIAHKNDSDMPTSLLLLEFIELYYSGKDLPEKVKRAIAAQQNRAGVLYVMLVGDTDVFPVRYIRAINTEWGTRYYPSDLYYADLYNEQGLFEDWDYNKDGFYGTTDFGGGTDTAAVNLDRLNLKPDVCVGRVLASSAEELVAYVNKVIRYERNAWRSEWAEKALVISDHGTSGSFSDPNTAGDVVSALSRFNVSTMYLKNSPYDTMTYNQRGQEVANTMNTGVGFISHLGHGDTASWASMFGIPHANLLSNTEKPVIAYSIGCHTAVFQYGAQGADRYRTVDGTEYDGRGVYNAIRPMPVPVQPALYDVDSLAEHITVKSEAGAVAYIGNVCKGEHGCKALHKYFVQNLNDNTYNPKLGLMWRNAMRTFADNEAKPGMGHYYAYLHQHKTMLFGDPSLRVGGVQRIQKHNYLGDWAMVHDGWRGTLRLKALPDDPIENYYNLEGIYTDTQGAQKQVRAAVRTPNYVRELSWQDNEMRFVVDFNGNLDFSDDQTFTVYLFTRSMDEMAGVTHWSGRPFGVSLSRPGQVNFNGIGDGITVAPPHLSGSFEMNHDGWRGDIHLSYVYGASIEGLPAIQGEYVGTDGGAHTAYGHYDSNFPHILTLYVDFPDTRSTGDDTRFDLNLFTQTKDGMAGVTHWHGRPFGARLSRTGWLSVANLSAAENQEHHFTIQVPEGTSSLTVRTRGGTGDPDLYVRRNAPCSLSNWDARSNRAGPEESIAVAEPTPGVYHIMVYGYGSFAGIELVSESE